MDDRRRVWTGVLAGVLAAGVLLSVGLGAYRAGQRDEVVTRVAGGGEVVRVIDGDRGWGHGPGPGIILFPLLAIGLVALLVSRGRGGGWCGPGPGWGPQARMPQSSWEDCHRRAHEQPRTDVRHEAGPGESPAPSSASGPPAS
jgi:hypothetical protein